MSLGGLCVLFSAGPVLGQADSFAEPATRFDSYGNARPVWRERRSLGPYASDAARTTFDTYQETGRPAERRGGLEAFSLPGDVPRGFTRRGTPIRRSRSVVPGLASVPATVSVSRSFDRYGGFGRRAGSQQAGDLPTLLLRRYGLMQATSLNAPVHRARIYHTPESLGSGLGGTVSTLPMAPIEASPGRLPGADSPPVGPLVEHLRHPLERAAEQQAELAWELFRKGAYREAARRFECVLTLEPTLREVRAGLVLCHVGVGATRTAVAVAAELARRMPTAFDEPLSLLGRFSNDAEARRLRLQSQLAMQAHPDAAAAVALHAFVLWTQEDRQAALRLTESVAGELSATVFAPWPSAMRNALSREEQR